jgi:KDO2-lipid IV(A) lauroyltransferase
MKLTDRILGSLVMGVIRLLALLPLGISQSIGSLLGMLLNRLNTRGAMVTNTNLELCLSQLSAQEREAMVRQSLIHTARTVLETPAAWLGSYDRILGWIKEIENEDLLDRALEEGRGVLILLPHIGNWELANVYFASRGGNQTGLYAPPSQAYLKPLMSEVRHRFGNELVPTTVKGIATLFKRLKEGRVVVVLPDQVPASGEFAPFFGVDALTDVLVPRMVKRARPVVLSCVIKRLGVGEGFRMTFIEAHPDIYSDDLKAALRGVNLSVEACVKVAPEQYQWEYKRFKERPSGEWHLYTYGKEKPWQHP